MRTAMLSVQFQVVMEQHMSLLPHGHDSARFEYLSEAATSTQQDETRHDRRLHVLAVAQEISRQSCCQSQLPTESPGRRYIESWTASETVRRDPRTCGRSELHGCSPFLDQHDDRHSVSKRAQADNDGYDTGTVLVQIHTEAQACVEWTACCCISKAPGT